MNLGFFDSLATHNNSDDPIDGRGRFTTLDFI